MTNEATLLVLRGDLGAAEATAEAALGLGTDSGQPDAATHSRPSW